MPKEAGVLITLPWESDRARREKTVQCCHCGRHHVIRHAFERAVLGRLGYCARCDGITCGVTCQECVPQEKWLDYWERGIDLRQSSELAPIKVFFPTVEA